MKTKFSNADVAKREFYATVQKRKEEVEDVLRYLNDPKHKGYLDFEAWYTQEWDWRFLRDILGGQQKLGMPWDYNNLIHKPTINGHTLTYGMSSVDAGLLSADYLDVKNGLVKEIIPDDEGNDHLWLSTDISVGTDDAPEGAEAAHWFQFGGKTYTIAGGTGDVTKEYVDTQLALKQNNVIYQEDEPTEAAEGDLWAFKSDEEPISYDDLDDKPSINTIQLQGDVTLSELDLYSKGEVDEKIGTLSATYRGAYEAGTTPAVGFDYDTFIKAQPEIQAITPNNNDYCYVIWSKDNFYDQCAYVSATDTWTFRIRIKGDTTVKYIELYGSKGNLTDEQLTILNASVVNYIWWANDTTGNDGVIFHCSYYNPGVNATYEVVLSEINYKINIDLANKTYTVEQIQFAKKDEVVTPVQSDWSQTDDTQLDYIKNKPHLYRHDINMSYESSLNTYIYIKITLYSSEKNSYDSYQSLYDSGLLTNKTNANGYYNHNNDDITVSSISMSSPTIFILGGYYANHTQTTNIECSTDLLSDYRDNVTQIF